MAPLAKIIFATLSVAVVVAATLSLREKSAPVSQPALTQQQMAELAPSKPQPPKVTAPVNDPSTLPPPPDDDLEDGNGS